MRTEVFLPYGNLHVSHVLDRSSLQTPHLLVRKCHHLGHERGNSVEVEDEIFLSSAATTVAAIAAVVISCILRLWVVSSMEASFRTNGSRKGRTASGSSFSQNISRT